MSINMQDKEQLIRGPMFVLQDIGNLTMGSFRLFITSRDYVMVNDEFDICNFFLDDDVVD